MTQIADSDIAATREYFALRSERYALSLKNYPSARILDLVPYCYALRDAADRLGKPISALRTLDAFGGTGFFSYAFRHSGMEFAVADCCPKMLELGDHHLDSVTWRETDDYFAEMADDEPASYDVILCHGGLHHVIADGRDGDINHAVARERQGLVLKNFARLLRPNGVCLLSDISACHPSRQFVGENSAPLTEQMLRRLLGKGQAEEIIRLQVPITRLSKFETAKRIRQVYAAATRHHVPRYFFDHFVQRDTPLGHRASFPTVGEVERMASHAGFHTKTRLDYLGPWLFPTTREAAWFFREKFSFGASAPLGEDQRTEDFVASRLSSQLGVRSLHDHSVAVNWGVIYWTFTR